MTRTLPLTKAREELPSLVNAAKRNLGEFVITVNGVPAAVLVSHDEYESWKETNEILADQKLMKEIKLSEKEAQEGKLISWEEIKRDLKLDE